MELVECIILSKFRSEPKKGGGGRGGIGNLKDEINQDKILSKVSEDPEAEQATKEP